MEILGIGTDIEDMARFRKKDYHNYTEFYKKFFSDREIEYCIQKSDPYTSFAGKFCAKESVLKAIKKNNIFKISNIEIINNKAGKPEVFINSKKMNYFLSIAHSNDSAIAFCVAYK